MSGPRSLAAAGYGNISGNEYFFPASANVGVIKRFWESGFVPHISSTNYFGGQTPMFGRDIRFIRQPLIKVRKRQRNQRIKHEQLDVQPLSVRIGEQLDYSYKVDDFDWDNMANKEQWISMVKDGAAQASHALIGEEMIHYIIANAACENQGSKAGKRTGRYNVGTPGGVLAVNSANIGRTYSQVNAILREQGITRENLATTLGDATMTLLVDSTFEEILMNSEFADKLALANCDPGCNMLVNGMLPQRIHGINTVVTNCMPLVVDAATNEQYTYIIGLARNGTGFAGVHEKIRTDDGAPDGWDMYLQGLMSYGYQMFYPETVVVFLIKYD